MDVIGTLEGLDPILQAFIAGLFTWFMTAAGAGLVFFFVEIDRKMLDGMLGFAAGVMIAASCFGLLGPAIDQTPGEGLEKVLPAAFGFILGGAGMRLIDAYLPHLHPGAPPRHPKRLVRQGSVCLSRVYFHLCLSVLLASVVDFLHVAHVAHVSTFLYTRI